MSDVLICASPAVGHLAPMKAIGADLLARGHTVRLITGSRFADSVTSAGLEHVPLRGAADFDHGDIDAAFPGRAETKGLGRLRHDVSNVFIAVMRPEFDVVQEQIAQRRPDVVIGETGFTGIVPLVLGPQPRPPVITCGVLPMLLASPHTPPFGPGIPYLGGPVGRARNRALNWAVQHILFAPQQKEAKAALESVVPGATLPVFFMEAASLSDAYLHLSVSSFEYPRPDLPANTTFVGPVITSPQGEFEPPEWWRDLDGSRPVVLVTQGTVDTMDLDRLIGPTLRGLADADVLVIAVTGGPPVERLGTLPANARAETFVPFDRLLPHVSVVVTNGGYGGAHSALAHGIPLVVAGDTEDKPEVAARVAWSGVGVNLRTGTPTPQRIAEAVRRVTADPTYRQNAARVGADIAATDALGAVADTVDRLARVR